MTLKLKLKLKLIQILKMDYILNNLINFFITKFYYKKINSINPVDVTPFQWHPASI